MTDSPDGSIPDYMAKSYAAVLRTRPGTVTRTTVAADIAGWDSMANVNLLLEIESIVGIRFKAAEVLILKDVGELVDLVERKLRAA